MAQIRTIDNQRHNVKETIEEITKKIVIAEKINTSIIKLNWKVSISSLKNGMETNENRYEPVSFIRQNIMMYY